MAPEFTDPNDAGWAAKGCIERALDVATEDTRTELRGNFRYLFIAYVSGNLQRAGLKIVPMTSEEIKGAS